jgi:peptide deformylase
MIIINNEEALRVKCADVLPEEVGELVTILESELNNANRLGKGGIGLAAPQIGIAKNIAIVRLGNNYDINLINCKVKQGFDPAMFKNEGCLSFPGRVENTTRFQEAHIVNNLEEPQSFIVTGLMAVVCQHEIDHLNSILFMDRVSEVKEPAKKVKVGPNDPCVCGSGKKYKRCCKR